MKLSGIRYLVLGAGLVLAAQFAPEARAQWWNTPANQPQTPASPPPSRGENLSAKPAAQLFASDCTGAGCHKGPQGLAKDRGAGSLASFLREHYTNSRESASALATYLVSLPAARTDPKSRAAARPDDAKPGDAKPGERKPPAAPTPPAAIPSATPSGETAEPQPQQQQQQQQQQKPAAATRAQRGRQATVTPAPPAAAPTPEPPAAPPEPPKPQWDIFD